MPSRRLLSDLVSSLRKLRRDGERVPQAVVHGACDRCRYQVDVPTPGRAAPSEPRLSTLACSPTVQTVTQPLLSPRAAVSSPPRDCRSPPSEARTSGTGPRYQVAASHKAYWERTKNIKGVCLTCGSGRALGEKRPYQVGVPS
jgi:hypothetical protein